MKGTSNLCTFPFINTNKIKEKLKMMGVKKSESVLLILYRKKGRELNGVEKMKSSEL